MKRYFVLLLSLTIYSTIGAQINSAPKGIKLNGSVAEIKKVLNDNGYEYSTSNTEHGIAYVIEQFYFSGIRWDYMYIAFVEGKCASVLFTSQTDVDHLSDGANMLLNFGELVLKIDEAYKTYLVSENIDHTMTRTYSDGKVLLMLQGKFSTEENSMMSLSYSSTDLIEKMMSANTSDL